MSTVVAIFRQMCPRCRSARIFRKSIFAGFPRMQEQCPRCGLKFEREQGYFLGAMYISYGLALITIVALGLSPVGSHGMVAAENNPMGNSAVLAAGACTDALFACALDLSGSDD